MTSAKRGEGGVSQKLTKVDKEGGRGFCQKLMSANYNISLTKIVTFAPLRLFLPFLKGSLNSPKMDILYHIRQSNIFFNFLLLYWTYLPKDMLLFTKIVVFFCRSEHTFPSTCVEKLMSARGEGGIFCQKADRSWQVGGRGQNWPNFGWRHLWTIPYCETTRHPIF